MRNNVCCFVLPDYSCLVPHSLPLLNFPLSSFHLLPTQVNGYAFTKHQVPLPVVPASQFPTMPLNHFTREGGGVGGMTPSTYVPLAPKKMGGSYADIYLTKLQRGTAVHVPMSVATKPVHAPPGYSHKGSLKGTENSAFFVHRAPLPPQATIPPPITSKRHVSLPEGLLPPSSISESLDWRRSEVLTAEGYHRLHEAHNDVAGASMSVSWPSSRGSLPMNLLRGSHQISPNVSAMVGGGEGCVLFILCKDLWEEKSRLILSP